MKKSNINFSLIKKILFVLLAAFIIELGVFNFSYWTLKLNSELVTNRVYTLNDMEIANWERQDTALVSQIDPILVIPGVDLMLKNVQIEADLNKSVPYITLFYTNEQYQDFNGEAVIQHNETFKGETLIQVDKEVSNLRIDLGDDPGVTLKEIKVTVNPLEFNFSLSRVIAMVGIYFGAVFLFSLQKNPDYGL